MDKKIRDLFIRRMGLILEKRQHDAAKSAGRVRSEASAFGALQSSNTSLLIRQAYEQTYEDICNEAWSVLHRIAVTIGVSPSPELTVELKDVYDEALAPLGAKYMEALQSDNVILDEMREVVLAEAEKSFARSREIVGTEVELFSSNTAMQVAEVRGPSYFQNYTISGPVGAIQHGDNASTVVNQNVNTGSVEALQEALNSLIEKFADQKELVSLIKQAKEEATRPQPRWEKLQGIFGGIRAFVKMLGEGKELLDQAENAATSCGMEALPPMIL